MNQKIITADKQGCDYILGKIYESNLLNDHIKECHLTERKKLRQKIVDRHNKVVELERLAGIRLGSFSQMERHPPFSDLTKGPSERDFAREQNNSEIKDQRKSPELKLKFEKRSTSVMTRPREDILSIPKPDY